jgi:hypothetical protein
MGWTKKDTSSYGETIDWDDTPEFEGVLLGSKVVDTKFGERTIYRFRGLDDGDVYEVWGTAQIDAALEDEPKGTKVRFEYKGMVKRKGGRRAHEFDIYTDSTGAGDDDAEDDDERPARKSAAKKSAAKVAPKRRPVEDDDEEPF